MKQYPLAQTMQDQCQYDPLRFWPLTPPAIPIFQNIIGETQNNTSGNISYYFYDNSGELWCRFGTFLHTPCESNERLCTHNLIGDVKMTRHDVATMIQDLQRVLKCIDNQPTNEDTTKTPEEIHNDIATMTEGLILTHTQRQIIVELFTIFNGLPAGSTRDDIAGAVLKYITNLYHDQTYQNRTTNQRGQTR